MQSVTLFLLTVQMALLAQTGASVAHAGLPVLATAERPALLLELGSAPASVGDKTTRVFTGVVDAHEGDASIQTDKDEISSLHPASAVGKSAFVSTLPPACRLSPIPFGRAGDRAAIPVSVCNLSKSGPVLMLPGWSCALACR